MCRSVVSAVGHYSPSTTSAAKCQHYQPVQAANYGRWRRFIVSVVTSVKPVCIRTKIFGNYIV